MRHQNKLLAVIAGAALALSGTAIAQTKAPAAADEKAATTTTRGVVKSLNADHIVIERSAKSGPKEISLAMDAKTQKEGDLKVGAPVTVHYHFENKQDLATSVHVNEAKKPAAKAGKGK